MSWCVFWKKIWLRGVHLFRTRKHLQIKRACNRNVLFRSPTFTIWSYLHCENERFGKSEGENLRKLPGKCHYCNLRFPTDIFTVRFKSYFLNSALRFKSLTIFAKKLHNRCLTTSKVPLQILESEFILKSPG